MRYAYSKLHLCLTITVMGLACLSQVAESFRGVMENRPEATANESYQIIREGHVALLCYSFDEQLDPVMNFGTLGSAQDGDLIGNVSFAELFGLSGVQVDGDPAAIVPRGDPADFNVADSDFSVLARIQTTAQEPGPDFNRFLFMREAQGTEPIFALGILKSSGRANFVIQDGLDFVVATTEISVNDGELHELLGVRKGDQLKLFIDGLLAAVAEVPPGFGSTDSSAQLTIGGRELGDGDDFIGLIDEVALFDSAILDQAIDLIHRDDFSGGLSLDCTTGTFQ